jgi:hypothetical protein
MQALVTVVITADPDRVLDATRRELESRIASKVPLDVRSVPEIRGERGKLQFVIREQ